MGRTARDNRDLPHPRPVQKIELSESNTTRRLIAAGLFLLIGAGALAYAFWQLMTPDGGWQAIQAGATDGPTCGDEFTFLYELGAGGQSVTAENKGVNMVYTQACQKAYRLFHTMELFEGVVNLKQINDHPNEVLEVDEALYDAFAAVREAGDRTVYLGPVYARYGSVFYCDNDSQLADFDPRLSEEVAEEYAAVAAYAADPAQIDVELLGAGQIRLRVSEEYLAYAQREEIDRFLDFGWLKNAFIADYLADTLVEKGYTHGTISSCDGFARCLDSREGSYSLGLIGRLENRPIEVGVMEYRGPMSLVSLRTFPAAAGDERRFYQLENGEVRTLYLDPSDGRCKGSVEFLTCYSTAQGCAQLAMGAAPAFIADEFKKSVLAPLAGDGAGYIYCQGRTLYASDPSLKLSGLYEGYTLSKP